MLIHGESVIKDFREKIIIDFIIKKQYCNIEEVVKGVKNDISRVTVFKTLRNLIENGAVQRYIENSQKRNSREHKLFVNQNNPFIYVPLELEQFDNAYFSLLSKALAEFDRKILPAALLWKTTPSGLDPYDEPNISSLSDLLFNLVYIFYSMVDTYLFRFLFKWSRTITDQKVLQKLYSMVFSKIADMQTRLFKAFTSTPKLGEFYKFIQPFIWQRFGGSERLIRYFDVFKEFDMQKEIELVIDSLWEIIGEFKTVVYPEPQRNNWPYDWRKLINNLKQYPELTQGAWIYDDTDLRSMKLDF
jgi:hypothetical protein